MVDRPSRTYQRHQPFAIVLALFVSFRLLALLTLRIGGFVADYSDYEFYYAWRKTDGSDLIEADGINSLYSMIQGLFHQPRLLDVIRNFVYLPDTSRKEEKILCRYPQY